MGDKYGPPQLSEFLGFSLSNALFPRLHPPAAMFWTLLKCFCVLQLPLACSDKEQRSRGCLCVGTSDFSWLNVAYYTMFFPLLSQALFYLTGFMLPHDTWAVRFCSLLTSYAVQRQHKITGKGMYPNSTSYHLTHFPECSPNNIYPRESQWGKHLAIVKHNLAFITQETLSTMFSKLLEAL